MKVGIIGAMEQEVTILKEAMTNCQTVNKANPKKNKEKGQRGDPGGKGT